MVTATDIPEWVRWATVDPEEFRRRLLVDTGVGLDLWDHCMDPWQREDFAALDAGWSRAVGLSTDKAPQRAYLERPRGHSKTTDIAAMASWALMASRRPIRGLVVAGSRDQAKLVRDAIERLVVDNGWLRAFLRIHNYEVVNPHTGSKCVILAADASTNYGELPDYLICDELTHWSSSEMWDAMFSAVAKRRNCMLVVISNAGVGEGASWQWKVRETARTSKAWYFSRIEGSTASWITEELLREQREMLPATAYKRLWLNLWVRGLGDALEPADIRAAITLPNPAHKPQPGATYVAGLDLGIKNDHCALVVAGSVPGSGRVQVARIRSWKPPAGGEIDLAAVRQAVLDVSLEFGIAAVYYDPHQAVLMAQDLRRNGLRMEEMTFTGQNLHKMASVLLQAFRSHRIDLFKDKQLEDDLLRLMIVEKSYGYKLEACRDENGHADRATALAIVLPIAAEISELPIREPVNDGLGSNLAMGVPA